MAINYVNTMMEDNYNRWRANPSSYRGLFTTPNTSNEHRFTYDMGNNYAQMGAGLAAALPRQVWDYADPVWHIADGRESTVGNVLSEAGVGMTKAGLQSGNFGLAGLGALAKIGGGLYNSAFGVKLNKDNIANIENNIAHTRRTNLSSALSNEDLLNNWGNVSLGRTVDTDYVGKNGLFNNKATRKANQLNNATLAANNYAVHGLVTGAGNVNRNNDNIVQGLTYAFGGPVFQSGDMGAIDYGFMSDYLASKNRQVDSKGSTNNYIPLQNVFCGGGRMFGIGGDLQTHGADWSTGTTVVDAGGTHEENPNEGVQMGIGDNGNPNLVEEGEVIYNDYVYSNRINLDDKAKEAFHVNKKKDITYADMAKKLGKEIEERPNDPISRKSYDRQMEELAEHQERQKQEMEAQKAKAMFESMTPEQQIALMQQMAQEEQMAQENAMQQPSPEEAAMMQQQMAAQQGMPVEQVPQGMEQVVPQDNISAYGGPINKFATGGPTDEEIRQYYAMLNRVMGKNPIAKTIPTDELYGRFLDYVFGKEFDNIVNASDKDSYLSDIANRYFTDLNFDLLKGRDYKSVIDSLVSTEDKKHIDLLNTVRGISSNPLDEYSKVSITPTPVYNDGEPLAVEDVMNSEDYPFGDNLGIGNKQVVYNWLRRKYPLNSDKELDKLASGVISNTVRNREISDNFDWLSETFPNVDAEDLRKAASLMADKNTGKLVPEVAFKALVPSFNLSLDNYKKHIRQLMDAGLTYNAALALASSKDSRFNENTIDNSRRKKQYENALRKEFLNYTPNSKNTDVPEGAEVNSEVVENTPDQKVVQTQPSAGNLINGDAGSSNAAQTTASGTSASASPSRGGGYGRSGISGLRAYGYYTNGTDGYSTPTGFTVDAKGNASNYTDEYRALVNRLTADDIRKWAKEHPDDPSLQSFLKRGNSLEKLTDAQWRQGALDGKYGFMHHVADSTLQNPSSDNSVSKSFIPTYESIEDLAKRNKEGYDDWNNKMKEASTIISKGEDVQGDTVDDVEPDLRAEWPRYVGLFGPAVGLGLQAAGVGKPDYGELDKALSWYENTNHPMARYKPIGNYMRYTPMDIWSAQNRLNALAMTQLRSLANSNATQSNKMAGILAGNYNNQIAMGDLYRKAIESNNDFNAKVQEFNRGTDKYNADAFNQTSQFNAQMANRDRQFAASLAADLAKYKIDANTGWYNSLYGNLAGLFKGIGDLGYDNATHNAMARLVASGWAPMGVDNPMNDGYIKPKSAANGGRINRKKNKRC